MSIENGELCEKCKFYHTFSLRDTEGTCRRHAPSAGGQALHNDMAVWPKVYGNSMFCGEFIDKEQSMCKQFPDSNP